MSNKSKFRAHESLNADTAAEWNVQTPLAPTTSAEKFYAVGPSASHVLLYSDQALYFTWNNATGTSSCSPTNDVKLDANTLTNLRVPWGVGTTPVLHVLAVSATADVRIVEA